MNFYTESDGKVFYKSGEEKVFLSEKEIENLNKGFSAEVIDGKLERKEPYMDTFSRIKIPVEIFIKNKVLQEKTHLVSFMFSDIKIETKEGFLNMTNINVKNVLEFINYKEYNEFLDLGVIFGEEIQKVFPVIGNVTSGGKKKIYHKPSEENFENITFRKERGDMVFKTEEEAKKEGFKKVKKENGTI